MRATGKLLLIGALAGVIAAAPARAEQASSEYPAPCDASKVSKANVERAHTVYLSGKQFLDESNYDKAIGYFKDAYSIDCSVHGILPAIATAYERKGDKGAAVGALQEYMWRAPGAADHDVVERRIKNLNDQLSREQPPPPAPALPAPAVTSPAPAGSTAAPAAASAPPVAPVPSGPVETPSAATRSPVPWILVGVGGAAVVGGLVSYLVGVGDVSAAAKSCPDRRLCAQDVASQGNDGRTLETAGVIVGGVGLAAVVGGLYWHFVENVSSSPGQGGARVEPVIAPGYAGITLAGRL